MINLEPGETVIEEKKSIIINQYMIREIKLQMSCMVGVDTKHHIFIIRIDRCQGHISGRNDIIWKSAHFFVMRFTNDFHWQITCDQKQGKSEGFESCDRPIVWKRPIWVKMGDVLSRVTLKFDG